MNPYEKLKAFNADQLETKQVYKQMQKWQLLNDPQDGVFCPSGELYRYSTQLMQVVMKGTNSISNYGQLNDYGVKMLRYFWGLHLFGAWRNTLGIYCIDDDIFKQIIKSPIPEDTPVSIFARLPEWCVYMQLPEDSNCVVKVVGGNNHIPFKGFWALFDHQVIGGKKQLTLNIVLDIADSTKTAFDAYQPLSLIIKDDMTVKEAVDELYLNNDYYSASKDKFSLIQQMKSDKNIMTHLLSLLLWLCAEEPDISNIKGEPISGEQLRLPKYRQNKKTGTFIPPNEPIIYHIGKRLGGEVRQFNEKNKAGDSRISSRKRPHIRKGHWHGVWNGTAQNKQFKIYWQPAIFVNSH